MGRLLMGIHSNDNFSILFCFRWLENAAMTLQQWRKKNDKANNPALSRHKHTHARTFAHTKGTYAHIPSFRIVYHKKWNGIYFMRVRTFILHCNGSHIYHSPYPHSSFLLVSLSAVNFNFGHGNFMFCVIYHSHNDSLALAHKFIIILSLLFN